MVVVEEGWPVCSISSAIIAIAMTEGFDDLDAPVLRVTDVDVPLPYAANLEKLALIKASQVVDAVKAVTLSVACATAISCGSFGRPSCARHSTHYSDIEDAMADVVARSAQPALAAIKLAWWRERLEELDRGQGSGEAAAGRRGHNRTSAARHQGCRTRGLEEGWAGLLHDPPEIGLVREHGARLFEIGARLLGVDFQYETIGVAGSLFAKMDVARRGLIAAPSAGRSGMKIARRARALTGLAALAARDLRRGGPPFEPEATPAARLDASAASVDRPLPR